MKHSTRSFAPWLGLFAALACAPQLDPFEDALARVAQGHEEIDGCETSSQGLEMMKCVNDAFTQVGVWWQENREELSSLTDEQSVKLHADMAALNARVQSMASRFITGSPAPAAPETPAGSQAAGPSESAAASAASAAPGSPAVAGAPETGEGDVEEAGSPASPDPAAN